MSVKLSQEVIDYISQDITECEKETTQDINKYYGDDEIAKDVLRNKYLDVPAETCPFDMWVRLAWGAAQVEKEEERLEWARKYFNILFDFKFIPGGRINYGLGRDDIKVSLSNCYVETITEDSLDGIYDCLKRQALTYKSGGGCGVDLSILRPRGTPIGGTGGASCGPVGFMELFSTSTNTVSQNNRRGASMISLDITHPSSEEFIDSKVDNETTDIIKELAKIYPKHSMSFSKIHAALESRRKIQHSNISVKVSDEFMRAVKDDKEIELKWGGKVYSTVKASYLWDKIITNAHRSAEPGILFWDRICETNNMQYVHPVIGTNPCVIGSTLIAVADGRKAVSIKQLVEEGKDVPVYSTNLETGKVEVKMGRNPRLTGKRKEVWKVSFSEDFFLQDELFATPDHQILMKDLSYKQLKDLKPGDQVFPSNCLFKTVVTVNPSRFEDVYNITVDDNHNYHIITTNYYYHLMVTSNVEPTGICVKNCGEMPLSNGASCNLAHMNLSKYVSDDGRFYNDNFEKDLVIATRFMDNVISINDGRHPLALQNKVNLEERRIGLGITGLGDLLIKMRVRYGSQDSLSVIDGIMATFRNSVYNASCDLAVERGVFPLYIEEKFFESKFIQNLPQWLQTKIHKNGMRNGMLLTLAPVGSGSIVCQVTSGGEPMFRAYYSRKVKQDDGVTYKKYKVYHPLLVSMFKDLEQLPDYVVDSTQILPKERVMVQAAIQPYIDNAISSTVNFPSTATKEQVAETYMLAWELGCKGITCYVEGSREGVLVSEEEENKFNTKDDDDRVAMKRPTVLQGETYKKKVDINGSIPYNTYISVNFVPGTREPYELLVTDTNPDKNIKDIMVLETTTRLISLALRHKVPVKFIVQQLNKIRSEYIYSLPLILSNILSNYVDEPAEDDEDSDEEGNGFECPNCKNKTLHRENGCSLCRFCGYSKC